jgi:peptidyl-Lys metalloendopeptidase
MAEQEFFYLGTIVTDTIEDSTHEFFVDLDPICPNMTNAEFRITGKKLLSWANDLLKRRIDDLTRNDSKTKERMQYWFGKSDEVTRAYLLAGFRSVAHVISNLKPTDLIRAGSTEDRALGCAPNLANLDGEAAHVCAPNIENRRIAISLSFCNTLRDFKQFGDSRVSTLIHEVTHFVDTFGSGDHMYAISPPLAFWGQRNSDLALKNADSLAGFVTYDEEIA